MAPLAQQEKRTIVLYINLNLAHEGKEGKNLCKFFWGVAAKEGKKLCKIFFGSYYIKKLLVVVEWFTSSVVFY